MNMSYRGLMEIQKWKKMGGILRVNKMNALYTY